MKQNFSPISLPESVRVYEVGGAVRDALLGAPVTDHDYVVVGATPEMMLRAGFLPVGRDFPVFLHPRTHEEYALARTERKSGRGYHGFIFHTVPDVTLEDDLRRRDLTVNAMARDGSGNLIDPFRGRDDLSARILRHVSPAFAEDPLRVLRVARFAARFGFGVADETLALMRDIVAARELETLAAERIWQETERALMCAQPSRFLQILRACGALAHIMPEVDKLYGVPQRPEYHPEIDAGVHTEEALDAAARFEFSLPVRYALLCHDLGKAETPAALLPGHKGHEARGVTLVRALSMRLKAPRQCADAALVVTRWHGEVLRVFDLDENALLALLRGCDAIRRPFHLRWLADASYADRHSRVPGGVLKRAPDQHGDYLNAALDALKQIDMTKIAQMTTDKKNLPVMIQEKQCEILCAFIARWRASS